MDMSLPPPLFALFLLIFFNVYMQRNRRQLVWRCVWLGYAILVKKGEVCVCDWRSEWERERETLVGFIMAARLAPDGGYGFGNRHTQRMEGSYARPLFGSGLFFSPSTSPLNSSNPCIYCIYIYTFFVDLYRKIGLHFSPSLLNARVVSSPTCGAHKVHTRQEKTRKETGRTGLDPSPSLTPLTHIHTTHKRGKDEEKYPLQLPPTCERREGRRSSYDVRWAL